jgi:hypothetical protein
MLKRSVTLAAAAAALLPAAAGAAPKVLHYKGKTKEGTRISFIVKNGWVDQLDALLPTTCVSAQGGTPKVLFTWWAIPYKFRLGAAAKVDYGDPTSHYHITTHRAGKRVTGKLSVNYSQLSTDGWGDYVLYECLGTAKFSLRGR